MLERIGNMLDILTSGAPKERLQTSSDPLAFNRTMIPAVKIEAVSKRYLVASGGVRSQYKTLRESIMDVATLTGAITRAE